MYGGIIRSKEKSYSVVYSLVVIFLCILYEALYEA
jgi:hypothetical protein